MWAPPPALGQPDPDKAQNRRPLSTPPPPKTPAASRRSDVKAHRVHCSNHDAHCHAPRPRRLGVDQQRLGGNSAASRRSRWHLVGRAAARAIFFRPRAIEAAAREDYLAPGRFPLADPAPARRRAPKGGFTRRRCSSPPALLLQAGAAPPPPALVVLARPRSSKPALLLPRLDLLPAGAARLQSSKVSSLPCTARSPPLRFSLLLPLPSPARSPPLLLFSEWARTGAPPRWRTRGTCSWVPSPALPSLLSLCSSC
ncbi:hypothetical protein PVAP13_9KG292226 [Panicum virgatum]|uniref:Uncharacterized protein n=1 Tax=Panicum virgatum TaxID=38727 RepID=A0A8T0NL91_PANVG|nr:hypothetical protein PVAP13_9KG292226 [Panicum virgatum]